MKKIILFFLLTASGHLYAQFSEADKLFLEQAFKEIEEISKKDNGNLWGLNFNQPVMVINENSREIIANKPDKEGILVKQGNIYFGRYPENKVIGNSITKLGGVTYGYISHPFPYPDFYVKIQLLHEIFHVLQPDLNIKPQKFDLHHIDNMNAKVLLKLEWAALEKALTSNIEVDKKIHIENALKFRKKRHLLYPMYVNDEIKFELQEGTAEYTGHMLVASNLDDYQKSISMIGELVKSAESIAESFPYYTGCLYGGLLYSYNESWGKKLMNSDDLGILLMEYSGIAEIDTSFNKHFISENYNVDEIEKIELDKEIAKRNQLLSYQQTFHNDTVLLLDLVEPSIESYPTGNKITLDSAGVIHQSIKLYDVWGKLNVKNGGCLINTKATKATIPASNLKIAENILTTENWELVLENDWQLIFSEGRYYLKQE